MSRALYKASERRPDDHFLRCGRTGQVLNFVMDSALQTCQAFVEGVSGPYSTEGEAGGNWRSAARGSGGLLTRAVLLVMMRSPRNIENVLPTLL